MAKRLALIPAAALAISVSLAGPAHAQDLYDCEDFTYQEEAQAVFDQDTSDPYGLDGPIGEASDGVPGVACESLPSNSDGATPTPTPTPTPTGTMTATATEDGDDDGGATPQVTATPTGGVPAGGGDGNGGQVVVLAGLATLLAAGGTVAYRRRLSE